MSSTNNHNPPHKHSQLTKKKKILLGTLIPFSLIIIALAVFLGLWFGRANGGGGRPTPPPITKPLVINKDTIDENPSYKVDSGTDIYRANYSEQLGNDVLNAKAYSDAHNHITDFIIEGPITFGFLVDPTMNFHLMGASGSEITITSTSSLYVCGIVIGRLSSNSGEYKGNMNIENSVHATISGTNSIANCVWLYKTDDSSTIYINGSWKIGLSGNQNVHGVYFTSTASGALNINGVWWIETTNGKACGVSFTNTTSGSEQTINGAWNVNSTNADSVGVYFANPSEGSLNINGVWNIAAAGGGAYGDGVYFKQNASGMLNINGVWNIGGGGAYGVYFYPDVSFYIDGVLNINGMWTVVAVGNAGAIGVWLNVTKVGSEQTVGGVWSVVTANTNDLGFGVYLNSLVSGTLNINGMWSVNTIGSAQTPKAYGVFFKVGIGQQTGIVNIGSTTTPTQYFSKQKDSGNIFQNKNDNCVVNYKWNGDVVSGVSPSGNNSSGDDALTLVDVSDDSPANITTKVISACGSTPPKDASKSTFNGEVITALNSYATNNICPEIAKQWLQNLATNISSI